MDIPVTITVPDYIYAFYKKVSEQMPSHTIEEIMASALFRYAGIVAEELHLGESYEKSGGTMPQGFVL